MENFFRAIKDLEKTVGINEISECIAKAERLREPHFRNHVDFEVKKLQRIVSDHRYNMANSREVYDLLIEDTAGGRLGEILSFLEPHQEKLGFALPHPVEYLLQDMLDYRFPGKNFKGLSKAEVKYLIYGVDWLAGGLVSRIVRPRLYHTTGFGRNKEILKTLKSRWAGGTYAEIGGSVGANAYEIKNVIGFKDAVSADILSRDAAYSAVPTIANFVAKKRTAFSEDLRRRIENEITFVWNFDILKRSVRDIEILSQCDSAPHVFGLHNILQYWVDKQTIIKNVLTNFWPRFYLWISSDGAPYNFIIHIKDDFVSEIIYERSVF